MHQDQDFKCFLKNVCVKSNTENEIPAAIGPFTQFMLSPLYSPPTTPSVL